MHSAVATLVNAGWLKKCGRRGRQSLYEALDEPAEIERKPTAGMRMNGLRHRLLACIRKADKARRSASARTMAQALFEIEKEVREVRDALRIRESR